MRRGLPAGFVGRITNYIVKSSQPVQDEELIPSETPVGALMLIDFERAEQNAMSWACGLLRQKSWNR